jgi:hypothetical protein
MVAIDAFIGSWTDRDLLKRIDDLPEFRSMVIYGRGVTDEGAALLSRCTKIKELHLLDTQITDEGMRHIGKLRSLDWLVLDNARVTSDGLRHLSSLSRLNGLHVVSTPAGDDGFSMLLNMPNLTYLEVAGENLRGGTISIISQLPELQTLRLASSVAEDRDFAQLSFTKSLKLLNFDMPLVSREAVAELNARLATCWIEPFRFFRPEARISYLSGYCMDLYVQRRYDLARNAANDVIRWLPFNPAAHGARAFINFELGDMAAFRADMENVRDNARLYGEDDLHQMANYFLRLESPSTVRAEINTTQPQKLFLERLKATSQPQAVAVSSMIRKFESLSKSSASSILVAPTVAQVAEIVKAQADSYDAFLRRLIKQKEEPVNLPWRW